LSANQPPIIAFAGRRIDPADADEPRFPAGAESAVADALRDLFRQRGARTIVSSAACGSDIIALEVAGDQGLERRVVLPFDPTSFRETSVVDRPGDWGRRYDAVLESLPPDHLTVLRLAKGSGAYDRTNNSILDLAAELAGRSGVVLAVIAWNGVPRGEEDFTARFAERARAHDLEVAEVDTLRREAVD
jgi:hypothetical protein